MISYDIPGCRHLLLAVGEMHQMGFQLVRIVPCLADSAGGGRWWCRLVPADMTSAPLGTSFTRKSPAEREGPFPFFPPDKRWQSVPFPATPKETAEALLRLYPELAARGRGTDEAYAKWYAEMLRLTHPLGLVIESHFADGLRAPASEGWRVVGGESSVEVVPLPPTTVMAGTTSKRPWWRLWG